MDIEDLDFESLTDKSQDEALEHLRQLRLNRRTPALKQTKSVTKKKAKPKVLPKLSAEQAKNILKMLEDL
jgi:hypothetical protein